VRALTAPRGDDGMSIFEVMIAVVLLMIVLIPAAYLVTQSSGLVGNQRLESVGTKLAATQLATARSQGVPSSSSPTQTPAWPSSPTTTTTVDSEAFKIYQTGGWCTAATSGSSGQGWGNGTLTSGSPEPSYFAVVKVAWGPGASSASAPGSSVIMSLALPGITGAPTTGTVSSCPLALT
jgi:Tfp pilus assembly protein PilV